MLWGKIKSYMRLGRLHSAVLTSLAPVCTAAAIGLSLSLTHYFQLFFIGFLFHVYLFILNETCDVDIDKTSKDLTTKPLVDGSIPLKNARTVVISSVALIFILTFVFFNEQALILIPIGIVALILGGSYDYLGKRFPHSDYFIAIMILFVALYGGFSVTDTPNLFVYVIAFLAMVQMLINNIIAGLKDADHDNITGGLSTPMRMGVSVKGKRLMVSIRFIIYVFLLKIVHISLTVYPFIGRLMPFGSWQFYMVIVLITIAVILLLRVLMMKEFNREKIMRYIGFHEIFTFIVIPFLLLEYIGFGSAIVLIFLPVIWLVIFLTVMYGRLMPTI